MFCCPRISIYSCDENQLDAVFIFSLFRQSTSTCFGHICSPSSGGILFIYSNWYVLWFSVDCLLIGRPTDSHISIWWPWQKSPKYVAIYCPTNSICWTIKLWPLSEEKDWFHISEQEGMSYPKGNSTFYDNLMVVCMYSRKKTRATLLIFADTVPELQHPPSYSLN